MDLKGGIMKNIAACKKGSLSRKTHQTNQGHQLTHRERIMKSKLLNGGSSFITAVLIFIGAVLTATGCSKTEKASDEQLITVLNPVISSRMVERVPLAPRIDTLEGKTIYLVDLQWGGPKAAYSVFEEMRDWFSLNIPSVKTEIRRSRGGPFGDDPALREEIISQNAGGVVIGIAG